MATHLPHTAHYFNNLPDKSQLLPHTIPADPRFTRITIVTSGDDEILDQIEKQVAKLIDVRDIKELKPNESVYRELVMIKVKENLSLRQSVAIPDKSHSRFLFPGP